MNLHRKWHLSIILKMALIAINSDKCHSLCNEAEFICGGGGGGGGGGGVKKWHLLIFIG